MDFATPRPAANVGDAGVINRNSGAPACRSNHPFDARSTQPAPQARQQTSQRAKSYRVFSVWMSPKRPLSPQFNVTFQKSALSCCPCGKIFPKTTCNDNRRGRDNQGKMSRKDSVLLQINANPWPVLTRPLALGRRFGRSSLYELPHQQHKQRT
jgi:hypothetical protein